MTINDFWLLVAKTQREHPEWRWGQTAFNVLHMVRPQAAAAIAGTDADPFNVDDLHCLTSAKFKNFTYFVKGTFYDES